MSDEFQYFIQVTDKWSRRNFAFRLTDIKQFRTVSSLTDYLQKLSDDEINLMIKSECLSENGAAGLEDIRSFLYDINDDGSLGDMMKGAVLKQRGRKLLADTPVEFEHRQTGKEGYADIYVAEYILDRDQVPFTRNWNGFYKRKWERNPRYREFIEDVIKEKYPDRAESVLSCLTKEDKLDFLQAVAKVIYRSPYEIYSRFTGRNVIFKNGAETLDCIMSGKGGNCSEKSAAFVMIAQNFGIPARFALGGHDAKKAFPYDVLRRALDSFDFQFKEDAQKYWNHYANIFTVEGDTVLIDATGGPIPLLFCTGAEASEYLTQKKSQPLNFITEEEQYYYHDALQDIAEDMLYSLEAFVPDIDLYHVLGDDDGDNAFGMLVTDTLWVCPSPYLAEKDCEKDTREWEEWGREEENIELLEVYKTLDTAPGKVILTELEGQIPAVVADLRTAEDNFIQRCRQAWRDENWKTYYVFVKLKPVG